MKALILSGGTGSRLRPLTYTGAKQLIPVANKPILFYAIEAIVESGIREIGIVVGDTKNEIVAAVGDGSRWDAQVTYIEQDAPRGLAHAVKIAEPYVGNDDFLMFLGDNMIRDGVKSFVEQFHSDRPNALILLSHVEEPQRFGVAEVSEGKVVRLVEKPEIPPSDLALVGVYLFDHTIFKAVKEIRPSWRNELEITDAIQYLVDTGASVESHVIDGWWKDTGKPEDVLEANRMMLEYIGHEIKGEVDTESRIIGRAVIEQNVQIVNSVIRGPVIIGAGSRLVNTYVGPFTSISESVCITNSEIENSIILQDTVIENISIRIDQSLIGKNVRIGSIERKPKALNFVLGDNSRVDA